MDSGKLTVMISVTVDSDPNAFNTLWISEILPIWEKCGARHLGSFAPEGVHNIIIRLLQFSDGDCFDSFRRRMEQSEEGMRANALLKAFSFTAETTLLSEVL